MLAIAIITTIISTHFQLDILCMHLIRIKSKLVFR